MLGGVHLDGGGNLQGLEHEFGDQAVAGGVHVHGVGGQDALGGILRIMLFQISNEALTQIDQLGAGFCGNLTADVGILIETFVVRVGAVRFFANHGGCAEDNSGANVVDLLNHVPEATLKVLWCGAFFASGNHPRMGPVPDVVDADVDEDDAGDLILGWRG